MFAAIGESIGRRAAERAVARYFASDEFRDRMKLAVRDAIKGHPAFSFLRAAQLRFLERSDLAPLEAWERAREVTANMLRDEGIKFGDRRFDWSAAAARDLADEEMQHWESA